MSLLYNYITLHGMLSCLVRWSVIGGGTLHSELLSRPSSHTAVSQEHMKYDTLLSHFRCRSVHRELVVTLLLTSVCHVTWTGSRYRKSSEGGAAMVKSERVPTRWNCCWRGVFAALCLHRWFSSRKWWEPIRIQDWNVSEWTPSQQGWKQ